MRRAVNGRHVAAALGAFLALFPVASCGGDDAVAPDSGRSDATSDDDIGDASLDVPPRPDATVDDGATDGGAEASDDVALGSDAVEEGDASGSGDSGSADADAPACTPPLAPCMLPLGGDGLCSTNGHCGPCTDVSDDENCSVAYADGASSGYICSDATCVPGDCHTAADCSSGIVCGPTVPHFCGPCTADWQCQNDVRYGANTMCDTTSGTCVPNSCGANDAPCTNNASDECCGGSCVFGDCCSDSDCSSAAPACDLHGCSACAPIKLTTYQTVYVDPVNGVDRVGNGSGLSVHGDLHSACAYKTLAFALAQLGSNPPITDVWLLGGTLSQATGETFPLTVPANVHIEPAIGFPPATLVVAPGADGFVLTGSNIGIDGLTVDGRGKAKRGFVALAGTSVINQVTVQNFTSHGIEVAGTASVYVEGVTSTHNGTSLNPAAGLFVHGNGLATLTAYPVALNQNDGNGLLVTENGSVQISGAAQTLGNGTMVVDQNTGDGIVFSPSTSTSGARPPQSSIRGVVVWQSGGNGIVLAGGSNVQLRDSYVLANAGHGIEVLTNADHCGGQAGCSDDDISGIDLGNEANKDWGLNTVQDATNPNQGVGICLSLGAASPVSLLAAGNVFSGPIDCRLTASALSKSQCVIGSMADVGIAGTTTNAIDTLSCSN